LINAGYSLVFGKVHIDLWEQFYAMCTGAGHIVRSVILTSTC